MLKLYYTLYENNFIAAESGFEQTVEEDVGVTEMNVQAVVAGNDGNNSSSIFEPMEVDSCND